MSGSSDAQVAAANVAATVKVLNSQVAEIVNAALTSSNDTEFVTLLRAALRQ